MNQNNIENELNEKRIVDQLRVLGIDMISEAGSGHPGIVLGAAPIIYTLYAKHLKFDPKYPKYFNRDRFVMSSGHGSALLYSVLYMAGFDISLDDLKKFRKLDSKTPGHPEYLKTPGVDATTGPLGEGFATAVGMAMAEAHLRCLYPNIIDYNTYVLCGDGDIMEGVTYEAASLAGRLKLNKLIVLYDSNNVCLDGPLNETFQEDIGKRFSAQGWNVLLVEDGENLEAIDKAINMAKESVDKPTLIEIKTTIGKYSKLEGTNKVHGSPLSVDDVTSIKEKVGIRDIAFAISQNCIDEFRGLIEERCNNLNNDFLKRLEQLEDNEKNSLLYFMGEDKSLKIEDNFYDLPESNIESPRITSSKILNHVVSKTPYLFGGAADLFSANKTYIKDAGDFIPENYGGKNIFYGVREHAMGSITNGLALCGFRSYASTFLAFSDFMKPSLRLTSMMKLSPIFIFTHDSISVGEDGPTHQPVEQLVMLRSLPDFDVFRPADANEVIGSYRAIFKKKSGASAIILSRNELEISDKTKINDVQKGAYIVLDTMKKPTGIVISCGEELHQVIEAVEHLHSKGMDIRVVSMPNIKRFMEQDEEYKDEILPVEVRKVVVEASSSLSWNGLIYNEKYLITQDDFGTSANYKDIYKKYGFDSKSLEEKIEELLK